MCLPGWGEVAGVSVGKPTSSTASVRPGGCGWFTRGSAALESTTVSAGEQAQRGLPDSRNAPLCRAPRLSVNMFFHVKPLVAR